MQEQDKVAQYLYNCPEYLESVFAAFKAGLVPVNTNYRYADDELVYLWDNADAGRRRVPRRVHRDDRAASATALPKVKTWLWVDDGTGPCPDWADALRGRRGAASRASARCGRRGAAAATTCLLYTGGTTGMPKGVMWRQDDLFGSLVRHVPRPTCREREDDSIVTAGVAGRRADRPAGLPADARHRPCSPRSSS